MSGSSSWAIIVAGCALLQLSGASLAQDIVVYESTVLVSSSTTWNSLSVRAEDRLNTSAQPSYWYRTVGTVTVNAPLTVASSVAVRGAPTATYGTPPNTQTLTAAGGIVNLAGGTLTTPLFDIVGPGVVNQNGGSYTVKQLSLDGGVTLTYGLNDTISNSLYADGGAVLSLNKNLTLSDVIRIGWYRRGPATIRMNGHNISCVGKLEVDDNSVIDRSSGGSLAANWFEVDASSLDIRAGDVFNPTPGTNYVSSGGKVTYTGGTMPGALYVSGTSAMLGRTTFTVNAPLQVSGLTVFSNGVFNQNSNVTVSSTSGGFVSASFSGAGSVNLNSGTLTTPNLSISGSGSVVQAGGAYAAGSVSLSNQASLDFTSSDRIASSLTVSGSGSLLTGQAPLSLSSLNLSGGGRLVLTSFTGTGGPGSWALRLTGNQMSTITGNMASTAVGSSNAPGTVVAIYDQATNSTFVTANITSAVVADVPASTIRTGSQVMYPQIATGGSLTKMGSGTLVLNQVNTLTGSTSVQSGRLQLAHPSALESSRLVPLAGGTVTLSPGLQTTVGGLDPNAGGLTDVGTGLVTVAGGLSATDLVTALLTALGDGSWNGTAGITSSVSATSGGDRTVGWLDNGDGSVTFGFAAAGDTNLDWQVDIIDAANFLAGGRFDTGLPANWNNGDFTYDGMVDILDAASFLSNGLFDAGGYNGPPTMVAVPEPSVTAFAAVGIVLVGLGALRRKREA